MSERDKAIEEAREFCYRCPNPPENWDLRGTSESMADFALDYHAKQNADAEKWIPVSERYPEEPQKCLITYTRSGDGRHLTRPSYWDGQRFERLRTPEYYGGVTAWMPLPKPYLEQAEGGEAESLMRALKERSMLDPDAPNTIVFTSDAASEY